MFNGRAIALGFFDGIHKGHSALLKMTAQRAAQINAEPCVLGFDVHPDTVIQGKIVPLLNTGEERNALIRDLFGINSFIQIHFDRKMMMTPWEEFIAQLIHSYEIRHIVIGHDFCFGYKGLGTAEKLQAYCRERAIGCDIVSPVMEDGILVSSTIIREYIAKGEMERANQMLGHNHFISGKVQSGLQNGTKMGTPTVNLELDPALIVPRLGVYISRTILNGKSYPSVSNVGVRPTVNASNPVNVETHILNFDESLYGQDIRVELLKFSRDERKFESMEALFSQIRLDVQGALDYFELN